MRTIIVALLTIFCAMPCVASSFEIDAGNGQVVEQVLLDHKFTSTLGVSAYGFHSKEWSEWYVGPTWAPSENIAFSVGAGRETGSGKTRWGGSVWVGKGRFSATYLWEDGGSGWWSKTDIALQASPKMTLALTNRVYTRLDKGLNGVATYAIDKANTIKLSLGRAGVEGSWVVSF